MIYERVLVGIDGSEVAVDACRLANRLRAPTGRLRALAVAETPYAGYAGLSAPEWAGHLRAQAQCACERVLREFDDDPRVYADLTVGLAASELLGAVDQFDADLLAIGAHGLGRTAGILLGSVATKVIHEAPCSVLVARGEFRARRFPQNVLVGIDGSEHASEAAAVAHALGDATHARVQLVREPNHAVARLVDASADADLLVVGSRGLHGLKSLGSVAERVAHEAHCPVLIIRNPTPALIAPHLARSAVPA